MYKRLAIILTVWTLVITPAHAEWTEPVRIGAPGGILYPQILAQGDTLHVVYSNNFNGWKIGYVRSTDGGDSWTNQYVLSDTINTTQTRYPRIVKNGNRFMTLWMCYFWQGSFNYNIGYRISNDNGLTWEAAEYIIDPGWTFPFNLAASVDGLTINLEASGAPASTMIFYSIRSTNFGGSWTQPLELFTAAQSSNPDAKSFGDIVHFTWGGRFNLQNKYETYYMRSTDSGISWTENISISEIDQYHSYWPSISVNETGNIALSWMDFKYSPYIFAGDIFLRGSFNSGQEWFSERQATFNHLANLSDIVAVTDTIHMVREDRRPENGRRSIYYMRSADFGFSWGNEYWLDRENSESRQPAMAVLNGNVYVIWSDDRCDPDTNICGGVYFTRLDNEVGIQEEPGVILPEIPILYIHPNPFNFGVTITLKIMKGGDANIVIYDINGRLIKTIFKGGILEKGTHKFTWDATDARGKAVSSGLYFAVAGTPQGKFTKTLTLIR